MLARLRLAGVQWWPVEKLAKHIMPGFHRWHATDIAWPPARGPNGQQSELRSRQGQRASKRQGRHSEEWCHSTVADTPEVADTKLTGGVKLLKKEMAQRRTRTVLNLRHLGRQLGPLVPLATQRHLLCSQACSVSAAGLTVDSASIVMSNVCVRFDC